MPKYSRPNIKLSALLACAFFSACGPRFDDAAELERQGRAFSAAGKYRLFALKNPADARAPEALLKASRLYAVKLGLCSQALPLLERLARDYPDFKLPPEDFRRIFVCPDYFPVEEGRSWTYGDTQTLGRNARQELEISGSGPKEALARHALYAGRTLVNRQKRNYYVSGRSFYERQGGFNTLLLSYPLEKGKIWGSSGPEGRLEFRVESAGLKVKVKAGEFENCVKIRRRGAGRPSWIYEYYAPWIGKIVTSVGGPGYENRVMELISYEEKKQ